MKREDIMRHAREQGLPETETEGVFIVNADDLGRMLSVEREACLDVIETHRIPVGNSSQERWLVNGHTRRLRKSAPPSEQGDKE
jgi:hypothetical protein